MSYANERTNCDCQAMEARIATVADLVRENSMLAEDALNTAHRIHKFLFCSQPAPEDKPTEPVCMMDELEKTKRVLHIANNILAEMSARLGI